MLKKLTQHFEGLGNLGAVKGKLGQSHCLSGIIFVLPSLVGEVKDPLGENNSDGKVIVDAASPVKVLYCINCKLKAANCQVRHSHMSLRVN